MYVPAQPKQSRSWNFTPPQVLALGFAAIIFLGAVLLWLPISHEPGQHVRFIDALFTATSAVCVTGLTTIPTAATYSTFGEVVIMLLIQAGGLGIMTLTTMMILMMGRRVGLRERLLIQEALGSFSIAGVVRLTRNIILVTFGIEAVGALLLTLRWLAYYDFPKALYFGLFHSVSAFNNAGFDLTDNSLLPFQRDPFILMVIAALIVLGGLGFFLMQDVWQNRKWDKFSLHTRLALKVTAGLLVGGALLYLVLDWANPQTFGPLPWYHKAFNALFASVTARTSGFQSVITGHFFDVTLLLTLVLMFVGANPGGTGGGIKVTTASLIFLSIKASITGKDDVEVMGRQVPKDQLDKAVTVTALAMGAVILATAVLLVTELAVVENPDVPISFIHVLFETVTAFGTVGLTAGLTPYLTFVGKVMIISLMFIGRVGPATLAVALAQRKVDRSQIHYPEERVMIG